MRLLLLSLAVALAVLAVPAPGPSTAASRARVTFVGDSVAASILYVPSAQERLERGLDVRYDLKVCRRLVQPSCSFQGSTPTTALQAVRGYGRSLGRVLIVNVGYNESGPSYAAGIDEVMRAALAAGATGVVWVTLRETSPVYRPTNAAIRAAAKRWRRMLVADWNAYSAGRPWFRSDGLHLNAAGANALVALLRPLVLRAAALRG